MFTGNARKSWLRSGRLSVLRCRRGIGRRDTMTVLLAVAWYWPAIWSAHEPLLAICGHYRTGFLSGFTSLNSRRATPAPSMRSAVRHSRANDGRGFAARGQPPSPWRTHADIFGE